MSSLEKDELYQITSETVGLHNDDDYDDHHHNDDDMIKIEFEMIDND